MSSLLMSNPRKKELENYKGCTTLVGRIWSIKITGYGLDPQKI